MKKLRRLQDEYRFPGFVPLARVKGIFGDPRAVVISLRRRQKKRNAGSAERGIGPIMTHVLDERGTFRVVTNESTSPSTCGGWNVINAME